MAERDYPQRDLSYPYTPDNSIETFWTNTDLYGITCWYSFPIEQTAYVVHGVLRHFKDNRYQPTKGIIEGVFDDHRDRGIIDGRMERGRLYFARYCLGEGETRPYRDPIMYCLRINPNHRLAGRFRMSARYGTSGEGIVPGILALLEHNSWGMPLQRYHDEIGVLLRNAKREYPLDEQQEEFRDTFFKELSKPQ